jgi:hypothetical protein
MTVLTLWFVTFLSLGVGLIVSSFHWRGPTSGFRAFFGVTVLLYMANAVVMFTHGWTECDRADCGRWYPYFQEVGFVLMWVMFACSVVGVVLLAYRLARRDGTLPRR